MIQLREKYDTADSMI